MVYAYVGELYLINIILWTWMLQRNGESNYISKVITCEYMN